MKKIIQCLIMLFISIIGLSSCSGDGYSEEKKYRKVRESFPYAHIYHETGSKYSYWIVIDTGNVYYRVTTGNVDNADITSIETPIELH